ncbi:EamA family transporter [Tessaracoccus oleiagri]|uniref:Threonine/homoserine efflux transporter RhtA n=1 Tax=Tessaracoccus oleiagri TaxID=686624 RepID=A0A1G9IBL0_9ACTN|nr:DMT family transporter [Tessaracoccus oleiagri]SDL22648.1 Threonine/homoserine efflux transporter RhtA [Tessaracoccus oleiagri]
MSRSTVLGFGFVILSAFFFAVSGPVAKALYGAGWTPGSVVLLRLVGSALLLAVPTLAALHRRWRLVRRHGKLLLVYGVVCMAGMQGTYFVAVQHLSVAVALLLQMMGAPLIIVAWLWARSRRRPAAITVVGIVVSLAGVLLVLDLRGATLSVPGVAAALASAACLAVYFFVSSHQSNAIPPLAFTGLGMLVGALTIGVAVATGLMKGRFSASEVDFAGAVVGWWLPAGLLVVFTVGAYVCGIVGLRHIGATVGSFLNLVEVPFSAFAAWLVLAEALTPAQMVGGLVILAGTVFVKLGESRAGSRVAVAAD